MKYDKIIKHFEGCGMTTAEAVKEVESILHYHTSGADAVSREYAIELVYNDLF